MLSFIKNILGVNKSEPQRLDPPQIYYVNCGAQKYLVLVNAIESSGDKINILNFSVGYRKSGDIISEMSEGVITVPAKIDGSGFIISNKEEELQNYAAHFNVNLENLINN